MISSPVPVTAARPSISAFFPCYNDERTIGPLVRKTVEQLALVTGDYEIVVVNDGSQDGSAAVLDGLARELPCLKVITHPVNRGYGGALRSGFANATKELVFYTDGDGQYDVGELPLMLMLLTPDTDFVNGMKMTRPDIFEAPWRRSTKTIGTSATRPPARKASHVSSTWKA